MSEFSRVLKLSILKFTFFSYFLSSVVVFSSRDLQHLHLCSTSVLKLLQPSWKKKNSQIFFGKLMVLHSHKKEGPQWFFCRFFWMVNGSTHKENELFVGSGEKGQLFGWLLGLKMHYSVVLQTVNGYTLRKMGFLLVLLGIQKSFSISVWCLMVLLLRMISGWLKVVLCGHFWMANGLLNCSFKHDPTPMYSILYVYVYGQNLYAINSTEE